MSVPIPNLTLAQFQIQIEREFIEGSAIDPSLYHAATRLLTDTEQLVGGEVSYPIAEALNWERITRFGHQARPNQYAIVFQQEDGSTWQAKLSHPRWNAEKNKLQKYETPKGNGSRAFLPHIPPQIRQRIGDRYGVVVPLDGSFWAWLAANPQIPIIITEGGKKALALLSQGYVAIALYGIYGGYRTLLDSSRRLIADIAQFATKGRQFTLAFDQDRKPDTRKKVYTAELQFGRLLGHPGCGVRIAEWDSREGKGVDDLIVNCGPDAFHHAYNNALPILDWRILQRLNKRLTYRPSMQIKTGDMSNLDLSALPERGLIAITAPKGTGKTKLISSIVANSEKSLLGGHRVALMRNLCKRLNLDYRGDLDKTPDGRFINSGGYTLRVGFCVDSLLAIDPRHFIGCDMVIDEVVQVVRHLLMSSTCAKDGKRPALLARFRELLQAARRVIIADADLDNATIKYIAELMGKDVPKFCIHNNYAPTGYPCRFIDSSDRTAIISELLKDARTLAPGKVLFVATDSKRTSKSIDRELKKTRPELRTLVVNSDTSGNQNEREFIQSPDAVLARREYDVIIVSPSLTTGVSIESHGYISKVYGIFCGASLTDADISQALIRIREPIERVVWCAPTGFNFCKVSRSSNPLEIKEHLRFRTSATVQSIRGNLKEDTLAAIAPYEDHQIWQSDPHINLYCKIAAEQNFSMQNLRIALLIRLRHEGNQVTIVKCETDPVIRFLLKQSREELRQLEAEALVSADDLTRVEVTVLESKEFLTLDEQRAIAKHYIKDFYCLDVLTIEDVLLDNEGRRRGELLNLEAQLYAEVAMDRTVKALEKQASWNQYLTPWDISSAEFRRKLRENLKLDDFLDSNREWTAHDLAPYAETARKYAKDIKHYLNFTISSKVSDTQIIHQLLSQLGIKTTFRWSRSVPGYERKKLRVYGLDPEHWQAITDVLERRRAKRQFFQNREAEAGSPTFINNLNNQKLMGDPLEESDEWLSPESLEDVCNLWAAATNSEAVEALRQLIPPKVLERAIACPLHLEFKMHCSPQAIDNSGQESLIDWFVKTSSPGITGGASNSSGKVA